MVCLRFPGGSWMAALMVMLMALSPPLAQARDTPPHFLQQIKFECHFSNGKEQVQFLERYIYNGQEDFRFDSDVGEFRALTELRRPDEKGWNIQKDILERKRGAVDTFCRYNYRVSEGFLVPWK
ncbi:HLA class II histocompatibility antigen, DRB1-4 beta chain-like, partial [Myotis lucifugus]